MKEHLQNGEIDVTKNIYLFTALEQELLGQNPANGLPHRKKRIKHSYKVKVGWECRGPEGNLCPGSLQHQQSQKHSQSSAS